MAMRFPPEFWKTETDLWNTLYNMRWSSYWHACGLTWTSDTVSWPCTRNWRPGPAARLA